MSFITSKSGIGHDTVIKIDGTDRTDWFRSFIPKTQIKTADDTSFADTQKRVVITGRSTTISADVRSTSETWQYFSEWQDTKNDQRTIEYSPDRQTKITYEVLPLKFTYDSKTLVLNFHAIGV